MTLLRIDADSNDWDDIVRSMTGHNVYQSAAYHRLAARMDGGCARLFYFENGSRRVAIPLIIRKIDFASCEEGLPLYDATSVYGYPGILSNCDDFPESFVQRFEEVLRIELQNANVVTVFVRLGTFRTGNELISGLGCTEKMGETIAIDLLNSDETRFKNYRRNHRSNIAQLRLLGATTVDDPDFETLPSFHDAYRQSMERVHASDWFKFGLPYFRELCSQKPDDVVLLQTSIGGELACGGLFFCSGDIAYAHLTATTDEWAGRSPMKVLFDDAARYFKQRGCRWLHIGGGLGAREDSLYRFKSGFSDIQFPFHVWKYVLDMPRYQHLCQSTTALEDDHKAESFFPQYRAKRAKSSATH